ncbi:MAG: PDZ domain-containing protein, partial [Planctomycetes bacterium]|nr:PDZ domain-containing protein [Planctomycetota bacterium]
ATGTVHRGYLGVQIKDLTPEVAERLGLKDQTGVEVRDVFAKSPAGQAGVKAGDVITSIDGKPVKDGRQLQRVVAGLPLNKPVDINIFRDGKAQTLSVTIKEQPKEFGVAEEEPGTPQPRSRRQSITLDKIGIEVTDLTPELAQQLGFKEGVTGALITRVHEDSPAADAGLARGLVVVQANKKPVKSARALQQLLTGAAMDRGVLLQVQSSDGGTDYVVVKVQPQEKE